MKEGAIVHPIAVREARVLRDAILRAGLPEGGSVYPGDDDADTLHIGAIDGDRLLAVATICLEAPPGTDLENSWRLRGMASVPDARGLGLGRRLALSCFEHAQARDAALVWCSARLESVGFYERLGFVVVGEPYSLPQFSDRSYVEMRFDVESI